MPDLPQRFKAWESPQIKSGEEVARQYERGFAGALYSPEARERFLDGVAIQSGDEVCRMFGYEDSAAGKLVVPFVECMKAYPGCFPGGYQLEGDCVSWSQRNANLVTLVCEAVSGVPDEVSGKLEALPEVSEDAIRNGVLSTEAIYAFRTTKPGHGWYCHESARVSQTKAGCVLRKQYDGIDLTRYSESTVNWWNRRSVAANLQESWDDNIIREATEVRTFEALRDLLARGFGASSCGSEGFACRRDENGVDSRRGSWAHAMAYIGVDDRPWAHQTYGGGLVLVQNSWPASQYSGPRKIHGTDLEIPHSAFWARWRDVSRRSVIVMAGANGWVRNQLPDYDPGW